MRKSPEIIKTCLLAFALLVSCLVCLYSILGMFQAINLAAGPSYSRDRLLANVSVWGLLSIISLFLIYRFLKMLYFSWRRRNSLDRSA